MRGEDRRAQVLEIAAKEFAEHGLHGASTEAISREAGITQAYIFRMFGTKKALFLELVAGAFERVSDGMLQAGAGGVGPEALERMGGQYYGLLSDRISLLLQLQGFAACGDAEVQAVVRERFARMWQVVAETTGQDAVTVKSFLAFGMLLNVGAAIDVEAIDEPWAEGIRTRVRPGLFEHITAETNR
jgi:AcrR family transcriptional regulator